MWRLSVKPRWFSTSKVKETIVLKKPLEKILIANRGEIACRIQRTAKKLGVKTVAVFSDADRYAQHVTMADEAYHIGPSPANESYLDTEKILQIAKESGAQGIHPGYGFLSENAIFAKSCSEAGIEFIGPPITAIEAMGSKSASKDIMIKAGVPVTPGYHGEDQKIETLTLEAKKIGYPVLIKAVLGGGGKGMRVVDSESELSLAVDACMREAQASFGDSRVLIEKFLRRPRHVELQIFGDKYGNVVHLFERDCSVQRRHQKVLEEAPAPLMSEEIRTSMGNAAVAAAKAVNYVGAGTVEFMLDEDDSFYFMEMNTRLQVEHPVTEMITRKDLVELQLKVAGGEKLPFRQEDLTIHGHAIEARVYSENPYNNFLPGVGQLKHMTLPDLSEHVRVDTGVRQGDNVSIYYDPMIAKLIVWAPDRDQALDRLVESLKKFQVVGLPTNLEFLARTADHAAFRAGGVNTSFLEEYGEPLMTSFGSVPNHGIALGAAILMLKDELARTTDNKPPSVWTQADLNSFRTNGLNARYFTLKDKDLVVPIKASKTDTGYLIDIDSDTQYQVSGTLSETGHFNIRVGHMQCSGNTVFDKLSVHMFCDDSTLRHEFKLDIEPNDLGVEGASDSSSGKSIMTPMPGKIIKVLVKSGDAVEADQPLLILEAMKMEHVIRATGNGTVDCVNFEEGDFVEDGRVLLEFE